MVALVGRGLRGSRVSYRHIGMVLVRHLELLSDEWGLLRTDKRKRVGKTRVYEDVAARQNDSRKGHGTR